MQLLRACSLRSEPVAFGSTPQPIAGWVEAASEHVQTRLADLKLPFSSPQVKALAVFWPS